MSGFEIAGVVLGIIPLTLKGYGAMETIFQNYAGFESHTRRQRKIYLIQRNQFRRSIRKLLLGFIDNPTIDQMIQDADHAEWQNERCKEAVSIIFSDDIITAEEYKATVELVQSTVADIEKSFILQPTSASQTDDQALRAWGSIASAFSDGKQRFRWAVSKKRKVDDLLSDLSRYNFDLERLVNQIRGNSKRPSAKFTPRTTFEDIKKIQVAYTQLYQAVTSACSTCNGHTHAVDLALEDEGKAQSSQILTFIPHEYRVMLHDGQKSKVWRMRFKHLQAVPKPQSVSQSKQHTSSLNATSKAPMPSFDAENITKTEGIKPLKTGVLQQDLENSSLQSNPFLPIKNLCLCLEATLLPSPASKIVQNQIGYVRDSGQSVFEVHLAGIESHPTNLYCSLSEVLSDADLSSSITDRVLQPYQRWKLAYLLSCSVLRLYSSPWLSERERWGSGNVKFYLNKNSNAADTSITTHLSLGTEAKFGHESAVVDSVKNYQIYALGVLLLEIAIGKSIDTSIIASNVDAELKEYLAVMRLDKHGVATRALGPQYSEIVSRCLSFKFNTTKHDLANIELQREFYNDVVCQLEGCLRVMTDPI